MGYLRFVHSQTSFNGWADAHPDMKDLLKSFLQDGEMSRPGEGAFDVSVYRTSTVQQELQAVAALTVEKDSISKIKTKYFGLIIEQSDLQGTGIADESSIDNGTCIPEIDDLHVNLIGTKDQFAVLAQRVLESIWRGENRLRIFPARQIGGEVASILLRLDKDADPGTHDTYSGVIKVNPWLEVSQNPDKIVIRHDVKGHKGVPIPVTAHKM